MGTLIAEMMWLYREKLGELLPGNSRDNGAHLRTSGTTWPKNRRISLNISGHTVRIFAILSPYERALGADDGSANNVDTMKAN